MNKKMDSIQAVRALAFLGILACHSGLTIFSANGSWGVSVFLILSGFLMFLAYDGKNRITTCNIGYDIKFGINKVKRLYPLHIVMLLLSLPYFISTCINQDGAVLKPIIEVLSNALLVQSWFISSDINFALNGVSWYLSVALFLYMMFPIIFKIMEKYKNTKTAGITIIVSFVLQVLLAYLSYVLQVKVIHNDYFMHWFVYVCPLARLLDFIIGCNLGYLFKYSTCDKEISALKATILEVLTLLIIIGEWVVYVLVIIIPDNYDIWWGMSILYTLSSCCLIYLFALNKGYVSKGLTNKFMIFIGNISASAFLIHQMIYSCIKGLERYFFGDVNDLCRVINIFLCLIITVILTVLWEKLYSICKNKINEIKANKTNDKSVE